MLKQIFATYVETLRNICLKGTILFIKMKVTINLSTNKVGALFSQKPNINIIRKTKQKHVNKREKKAIEVYKREKKAIGVYKREKKAIGVYKKRKESYWSI